MNLSLLAVIAAAALGAAIAVGVTALIVVGTVALALVGAANGVRTLSQLFRALGD
jgi:hypothetical protein